MQVPFYQLYLAESNIYEQACKLGFHEIRVREGVIGLIVLHCSIVGSLAKFQSIR